VQCREHLLCLASTSGPGVGPAHCPPPRSCSTRALEIPAVAAIVVSAIPASRARRGRPAMPPTPCHCWSPPGAANREPTGPCRWPRTV